MRALSMRSSLKRQVGVPLLHEERMGLHHADLRAGGSLLPVRELEHLGLLLGAGGCQGAGRAALCERGGSRGQGPGLLLGERGAQAAALIERGEGAALLAQLEPQAYGVIAEGEGLQRIVDMLFRAPEQLRCLGDGDAAGFLEQAQQGDHEVLLSQVRLGFLWDPGGGRGH